jgi:CbiX
MYSVKMMGRIWYLFGALLIVSLHINAVTAFVVPGCRSLESMTRRVHHTSSPFGIPLTPVLSSTLPVLLSAASGGENDEIDLFEYFDPLLSPHAYPDGVLPNQRPKEHRNDIPETTLPKRLGFALPIEPDMLPRSTTTARNSNTEKEDLFDYFDPLLSPHAYPQGINPDNKPDELIKNTGGSAKITKRVGILIIDHGSKKSASNARLQALAELYQSSMDEQYENDGQGDPLVIVKAAHMEIASPSIPDGLRSLHDAGVDEIICHPFFLSPDGRHVKEDIPEIISSAIETLNIRIPVITTEPVGSNIPLMLNAIHTLVVKNSEIFEE